MTESTQAWGETDLAEVVRRELMLLLPVHRGQPDAVLALLHPDFEEFGASGRRWDGAAIAESLAQESQSVPTQARDIAGTRLAEDVFLLTYTAHAPERVSLRSSVWLRDPNRGWLLRFHQGTPRHGESGRAQTRSEPG